MSLRDSVIKLAAEKPELRKDLLPILRKTATDKTAMEFPTQDALDKYLKEHPDADRSNHSVKKHEEKAAPAEKKDEGKETPAKKPPKTPAPHKKVPVRTKTLAKVQNVMQANGLKDDDTELKELAGFKQTLGQRVPEKDVGKWFVRNQVQLKADFVRNMDPTNYDSPEQFKAAKDRIQKMTPNDFGKVLAAINDDEIEIG